MKQIWAWFIGLFRGGKKKPPVIVVPPPDDKPPPPPIDPPKKLNWSDRRAIGMIMLSNYQTWTDTDNYMNGEIPFDEWLIQHANNCIATLKEWKAQGAIVWDPEGTKFPRAYTYFGDPKLTPQKVNPFFTALKDAGFRVGVCLRPDIIKMTMNPPDAQHWAGMETPDHYVAASPLQDLIGKVEYSKARWGCTLFYIDSNVGVGLTPGTKNTIGSGNLMPASIFAELNKLYPDCLFIPEWHDASYEPYTALYWHKGWGPPNINGVAVVDCGDTNWPQSHLDQAVKDGHILMGRAWWGPEIPMIKAAYNA